MGGRRIDRPGGALGGILVTAQHVVLRTARGPLRPLWGLVYELVIRATAAYLRAGESHAAVYLRGSLGTGEPLYGAADIDLAIVVPAEPGRKGAARRRTHQRWRALARWLPPLRGLVQLKVYEGDELRRAATTTALTARHQSQLTGDEAGLRLRPGLVPPTSDWRRIAGPELRPRPGGATPERHLSAWLELQWWWRLCFDACLSPHGRHIPYLCLKLITQSARVRLLLERGELVSGHTEVLARALATLPDEEDALRKAERLWQELPLSPDPPLAEATSFLARTTARVAELLAADARATQGRAVELFGIEGAPALTPTAQSSLDELETLFGSSRLLPLADWRARTSQPLWRAARIGPLPADERLALVVADSADPEALASLASASVPGLRPALAWDRVLILPSASFFDSVHRCVQFTCSDPVSFALLAGERIAVFPAFAGWSATDSARRAVDAHATWLEGPAATGETEPGTALGLLLGAVRAALFQESIARGEPELSVTVAAAAHRLASEHPSSKGLLDEAVGAFRARSSGEEPTAECLSALRRLVERLPAYRSRPPDPSRPSLPGQVVAP